MFTGPAERPRRDAESYGGGAGVPRSRAAGAGAAEFGDVSLFLARINQISNSM
jgi:hypothetical protein